MAPIPTGRGAAASVWLADNGLPTRQVKVRASDFDLLQRDPFEYYLKVRLGLTPILSASEALSHGSWFHKAHECWVASRDPSPPPETPPASYEAAIGARLNEIATLASEKTKHNEAYVNAYLDNERKRATEAWTWYHVAMTLPLPGRGRETAWDVINKYVCLGTELLIETEDSVIQIDDLRYNPDTRELHPFDLKTTSCSATHRLSVCPFEFQSLLYTDILMQLLEDDPDNELADLSIPEDSTFGQMHHLVVQKPTIRLSSNDRPFTVVPKTLKSGPRKGQTIPEKIYEDSPPRHDLYLKRCIDWAHGRGDYLDEREARQQSPIVNISSLTFSNRPEENSEFSGCFEQLRRAGTVFAWPDVFPRNAKNLLDQPEGWPYAPFYTRPIREWPDLVQELGLTQRWRSPIGVPQNE